MQHSTLVFTIALNGYQWRYRQHMQSHREFAAKYGFHYQAITRPFYSSLGIECCWLKLTLMLHALRAGYKQVIFLDADTLVNAHCPDPRTLFDDGKWLYMAKGYSKRFNSGVMIARNHPAIRLWLTTILKKRHEKLSDKVDVGWGENGHIIAHSIGCPFIKEIPHSWNNTHDKGLDDFIRHYNSGPMRSNLIEKIVHYFLFALANKMGKLITFGQNLWSPSCSEEDLERETLKILNKYPDFIQQPFTESTLNKSHTMYLK